MLRRALTLCTLLPDVAARDGGSEAAPLAQTPTTTLAALVEEG